MRRFKKKKKHQLSLDINDLKKIFVWIGTLFIYGALTENQSTYKFYENILEKVNLYISLEKQVIYIVKLFARMSFC